MRDWAQKLIEELENRIGLDTDDAIRNFASAYANGDSAAAWEKYLASVKEHEDFGNYTLLVFEDGSCYANWFEGIDRFFPTIYDVADKDPDFSEQFSEKL